METTKKVYLANLKSFGNFGSIKGRIYADKTAEHWQTDDKGRKYLPIIINVNKEPDQYGNTHVVVLDTWKPSESIFDKMADTNEKVYGNVSKKALVSKSKTSDEPLDLPF